MSISVTSCGRCGVPIPEFVLETLGDERIHHECSSGLSNVYATLYKLTLNREVAWDVLRGLRKLYTLKQYSTGGDCRNNISASMIEGSSYEILIKEVNVNRSGSLVVWSTVLKKDFDLMSNGEGVSEYSADIGGFSVQQQMDHTTATNTGGSVITLTVERVKEALEKPRPPSPSRGDWQLVGADDIASEILQDELRQLKMN
ncbi:hypothetical protein Tco_1124790 [Tanacetum coccineum]|uniref:Uncharacterized protein n=1 Tax=Tanacetum coccineum TaxID=301880 RepID=A0ABQ5J8S9_9ASTR